MAQGQVHSTASDRADVRTDHSMASRVRFGSSGQVENVRLIIGLRQFRHETAGVPSRTQDQDQLLPQVLNDLGNRCKDVVLGVGLDSLRESQRHFALRIASHNDAPGGSDVVLLLNGLKLT